MGRFSRKKMLTMVVIVAILVGFLLGGAWWIFGRGGRNALDSSNSDQLSTNESLSDSSENTAKNAKNTVPGTPALYFVGPSLGPGSTDNSRANKADQASSPTPVAVFATVGSPGHYPPDEAEVAAGEYLALPEAQKTSFAGKITRQSPVAHEVYARSRDGHLAAWVEIPPAEKFDPSVHTVELAPARTLQVEVVDADDQPVEGAQVRVSQGLVGLIHLTGEVDQSSKIDFLALPEGDFRLTVDAPGFVGQSRHFLHTASALKLDSSSDGDIEPKIGARRVNSGSASSGGSLADKPANMGDEAPNKVKITLDRGARLVGKVVDGAGRGVPGATVEVIPVSPFADEILDADFLAQVGVASQRKEASGDGAFSVAGVDVGAVQVRAEAPGWSPGLSGLIRVKRGATHQIGEIVLDVEEAGEELLVRVETTNPAVKLSAVELLAERDDGSTRRCRGGLLRAADWRFPNCGYGTRTLIATTSDGLKLKWRGEFGEATEVVLDAPAPLEIFAVDENGAPIEGALVEVWQGDELVLEAQSRGAAPVRFQAALPFEGAIVVRDARVGAGREPISLKNADSVASQGARHYAVALTEGLIDVASPGQDVQDIAQIAAITGVEVVRDGRQLLFDMVPPDSPAGDAGLMRGDALVYLRQVETGYRLVVSRGGERVVLRIEGAGE